MSEFVNQIPWCPQCGPTEKCDEDGCCLTCGADMGFVPDYVALQNECDKYRAELEAVKAERDQARRDLQAFMSAQNQLDESCIKRANMEAKLDIPDKKRFVDILAQRYAVIKERNQAIAERDRLRGVIEGVRAYLQRRSKDAESDAEIGYPPLTEAAAGWLQARNEIIDELNRLDADPPECVRFRADHPFITGQVRHALNATMEDELLIIRLPKDKETP